MRPSRSASVTRVGKPLAQALGLARKHVRQIVLAQRDLDLHAGIGVVAEHLHDARRPAARASTGCTTISTVTTCPGLRAAGLVRRDQEVAGDALVLRHDEEDAVLARAAARRARCCARSSTSTILPSGRPRRSMPAMRATTRSPCSTFCISLRPRKRSGPPSSRTRKPKPSGWPCTRPRTRSSFVDDADRVAAVADDLAVALHRGEPRAETRRARCGLHVAAALRARPRGPERPARSALRRIASRLGSGSSYCSLARVMRAARARSRISGAAAYAAAWPFALIHLIDQAPSVRIPPSRPGGGIGRRTRFRSWRWQHCGGSSPFLGTTFSSSFELPISVRSLALDQRSAVTQTLETPDLSTRHYHSNGCRRTIV